MLNTAEAKSRTRWLHSQSTRLLVAIGLFWMGLYLYIPVLTLDVVRHGGTAAFAGLVVAAYGIPQLLVRISLGVWADRLGRLYPFMIGGFALVALSSLGMAVLQRPVMFLLLRVVAGLAASTWAMFTMAYTVQASSTHTAQAMGWVSFANSVGQVVASLVGGFVAERWGWSAPFWLSVLIAFMGIVMLGRPRRYPAHSRSTGALKSWRQVITLRSVRHASILGIILQAITFMTTYGYTPLFAAHEGVSRAGLGLLTAVSLVSTIIATVVSGSWLSRRVASNTLLMVSFVIMAGSSAVTPWVGATWGLFVTQAVLGASRGLATPLLMAWTIQDAPPEQRTTAMATYQSLYAIGMIGGPILAARIVAVWGLSAPFAAAGGIGVLALVLLGWVGRERTRHMAVEI
ncbi:MAG: MFS transporter [Firmicutes bacterium]|nr:MFS transporter [Bacillota bacterium]